MTDDSANSQRRSRGSGRGAEVSPAFIEHVLDGLIAEYTSDTDAVLAARRGYEDRRGRVHEDDPLWERWSAAFVEWYVVERVAEGQTRPYAAASAIRDARAGASGDVQAAARADVTRALVTSCRSLYEVTRLDRGHVELLDLLGGGVFRVGEPRAMHGVELGDIAELRLLGAGGQAWFGRTFIFHPHGARDAILDHARAALSRGQTRRQVIDYVATLRVKVNQYRHVVPARVYELGGRLNGDSGNVRS